MQIGAIRVPGTVTRCTAPAQADVSLQAALHCIFRVSNRQPYGYGAASCAVQSGLPADRGITVV